MTRPSVISKILDDAEKNGILNLRTEDIAKTMPGVSADALRQALHRLQRKGRISSLQRGSGHWVIIPLRDAHMGAPALEAWLHTYMTKTLNIPYYVGLLSAAEIFGASPYAVMNTQVVVANPRRNLTVGRHTLRFFSKQAVEKTPTQWHETPEGRFRISTPEVTGLELLQKQLQLGGSPRTVEVLRGLFKAMSPPGLLEALNSIQDTAAAQRLGALMITANQSPLAEVIQLWLASRRIRPVTLAPNGDKSLAFFEDTFRVYLPHNLEANA